MNIFQKAAGVGVMWLCLAGFPGVLQAQSPGAQNTEAMVTLFQEQNEKLSGELRRIQRELAALRADLAKPGLRDIMAGIGYIVGLCGMAAFFAARRKE